MKTVTIRATEIKVERPKAVLAVVEDLDVWLPKSQITLLAYRADGVLYRIPLWLASKKGLQGQNTADALVDARFTTPEGAPIFHEDEFDTYAAEAAAEQKEARERSTLEESDERHRAPHYAGIDDADVPF